MGYSVYYVNAINNDIHEQLIFKTLARISNSLFIVIITLFMIMCINIVHADSYIVTTTEKLPVSSIVAKLRDIFHSESMTQNNNIDFSMAKRDEYPYMHFIINHSGRGILTIQKPIDRDELCRMRKCRCEQCDLHLEIILNPRFNIELLTIRVLDLSIVENAKIGSILKLEPAVDRDYGQNSIIAYHLLPSSGLPFIVQYDINRGDLSLIVHEQLDREKNASYSFLLVASDGSNRTGFVRVFVAIQDVNDHSPIFDKTHYSVNITENSHIGTTLIQVHATDLDEGRNAQITYQLLSSNHDETSACFDLDENTGHIRLTCQLDYEYRQRYNLEIEAKDDGEGSKTGYCTLQVNVVNVNDNQPQFQLYPSQLEFIPYSSSHNRTNIYTLIDQEHVILYLSETFEPNTVLFSFLITDSDLGDNGQIIIWTLMNNNSNQQLPFDIFRVTDNAGDLRLINSLDRELTEQYKFGIMASDNGNSRLTTVLDIHVLVTDVNDETPQFRQQNMTATINEHVSMSDKNGYEVYHVQAYDLDKGLNGQIEYRIISTDDDIKRSFTIDRQTGIIRALTLFDREKRDKYVVEVEARDKGNLSLASRANILFLITDQNDHAPVCYDLSNNHIIGQSKIEWSVKENSAYGTIVGRMQCHDIDMSQNGLLGYNIHFNDSDTMTIPFKIKAQNITRTSFESNEVLLVSITVNGIVDRELKSTYNIFVQIFDNGNPRHFSFVQIVVTIIDVNDNCAELDSSSKSLIMINRDLTPIFIRQLHATDNDIQANGNITFDLINTNPNNNSYYVKLYSNGSLVIQSLSMDDGYITVNIQIRDYGEPIPCIVSETIMLYIGSNRTDWTSSKLTQHILLRTNETYGKRNSNSRSANYNSLLTTEETFFRSIKYSTSTKNRYIIILSLSIFIFVLVFATLFCMIDRICKNKTRKLKSSQNGHLLSTHKPINGIIKKQEEKNDKQIHSPTINYNLSMTKSPSRKRLANGIGYNSFPPSPANYIRLNTNRTTSRLTHSSRSNSIMSGIDSTIVYTRGYSYTPIETDDFYPQNFNDSEGIELRMTTV
ncbi:unnamed protein product [Didymodactylos carnosus]|uniref:Cadherin domain-containing protein n=1 Tax=Didymodactylos carnosus TaxID=1234261 RepID=A0A814AAJ0_9BILA|nr:unnamed protein product [Didymodactylos carnosus]CAF0909954.1 unnamed protein product [Didymodactylos carnosus]CAF3587860.1 unnamed protein product [Didymodactylos carnosus]CAF3691226.1 unnamed protein product [Didymodactylos carnosus]